MIDLEGRNAWGQEAPFHGQLELEKEAEHVRVPSEIQVQGRVVRVFRSDGRLAPGDHVSFKLWVCRRGDEPTVPAYVYHEDFVRATHMEVYLQGRPRKCELAACLSGPSEEPSMNVGQLEELLVRWQKIIGKADAPGPEVVRPMELMGEQEDTVAPSANAYMGSVGFMLRDPDLPGVVRTIEAFGTSATRASWYRDWTFPSESESLLEISLIPDVGDYFLDLLWDAVTLWEPLFAALNVEPEEAIIVHVTVANRPGADLAVRRFALALLGAHAGVARDHRSDHVWTFDEIRGDVMTDGARFFAP